jgi:hypothetical protein
MINRWPMKITLAPSAATRRRRGTRCDDARNGLLRQASKHGTHTNHLNAHSRRQL